MKLVDTIRLWRIRNNKEYFADIILDSRMDRENFLSLLFNEYCGMTVLYDDTETQHDYTLTFFIHMQPIIKRMLDTTQYQYTPLSDYSIKGEHNIGTTDDIDKSTKGSDSATDNDNSNTNSDANMTNSHYVSAFNQVVDDSTLQYRDTSNGNEGKTYSDTKTHNGSMEETGKQNRVGTEEKTYGESGIRNHSYQELIEKERKLALYDVERYLLNEFAKNLLVGIW